MSKNTNKNLVIAAAGSKRPYEHLGSTEADSTNKAIKIHPFFQKSGGTTTTTGHFQWLEPLGPTRSCLHAINFPPKLSRKIAAFDLDGTLIKASITKPGIWEWWRATVPAKLKDVVDSGYNLVIVSNQALKPEKLKIWKLTIPLIAAGLPDVPFRLFAATARDGYRKPMPGIWQALERIYRAEGIEIDKTESFFVGDAAGRQFTSSKHDFASTDRKWALNAGIDFLTPEEYFLKLPQHKNYSLPGFHVSSLNINLPYITPTSSTLLPAKLKQELVLFVGYPCMGKTSFYRRHFELAGYTHVNQDTLKTRDRCVKMAQASLQEGKSCVIDNTNRNVATRKHYLEIARHLNVPTRCFVFEGSLELAWHNNLYRSYNLPASVAAAEPSRELVPYLGFSSFRDSFEEPLVEEGFTEVRRVNWIFTGNHEEKKYWSMWLQIDGK